MASLNIAALARRTGVAPDTLRKWEQRYGVLHPARTRGGQRRYSELDIARVEWLKARVEEGIRIGEAAAMLETAPETAATAEELRAAILRAVAGGDRDGVAALVDRSLALHPLPVALQAVLAPALRDVGDGWASGEISIAQEHLVTSVVRSRLETLLLGGRGARRGSAVVACPAGERHELGAMMFGVLLRADGWRVFNLGADLPLAETLAFAESRSASVIGLSVTLPRNLAALVGELVSLGPRPAVRLLVGGAAATPERMRRLPVVAAPRDLGEAVRAARPQEAARTPLGRPAA